MLYDLRGKVRYLTGLWRYWRETIGLDEAKAIVRQSLAKREENFLRLAELGIYGKPDSPFGKLLLGAGIELDDLKRMVGETGLAETLGQLYDSGVYVTYDEMRGRSPVKRNGLEFTIDAAAMDNPLLEEQYEMTSSGSSGNAGSRAFTDLALLRHEAAHYFVHLQAHGLGGRPIVEWGPVPPSLIGLTANLRFGKFRMPVRWFSHTRFEGGWSGLRGRLLVLYTLIVGLLAGRFMRWPQHVPTDDPLTIARYLAAMVGKGTPAAVQMTASAATRTCLVAQENGLDLTGTLFRVGGEPYTPAKAAVVEASGAYAFSGYMASELGLAGGGCASPGAALDDLHLVTDKFHVFTREKAIDEAGTTVPALVYTTLHPNCRKIMLNAESGDYGYLEERDCGCLIGEMGFRTHLTGLHGYDKLTSEGVTFMGSDLFKLVEEVLPGRFGGAPTDYQLAEEEDENGISHVSIIVAPGVGPVDEEAVVSTVLQALGGLDGSDRGPWMAERWRQGKTLRVLRRQPYSAGGRKVLPLHLIGRTGG
jgi:hypothetical protein